MSNFRRLLFFLSLFTVFSGHLSAELSANVTEAPVGSSVTLTWSSSASSCSALGEWSGTKNGSGSEVVNVPNLGWNMYGIGCNYIYEYVWVWGTAASTTPTNSAPTINGLPSSVSVAENQTSVTSVSASDSDGDALTYSLSGSDSSSLSISSSGVITFNSAPDYETKNTYSVTVNVSDGTVTTSKALTINITDLNETGGNSSYSTAAQRLIDLGWNKPTENSTFLYATDVSQSTKTLIEDVSKDISFILGDYPFVFFGMSSDEALNETLRNNFCQTIGSLDSTDCNLSHSEDTDNFDITSWWNINDIESRQRVLGVMLSDTSDRSQEKYIDFDRVTKLAKNQFNQYGEIILLNSSGGSVGYNLLPSWFWRGLWSSFGHIYAYSEGYDLGWVGPIEFWKGQSSFSGAGSLESWEFSTSENTYVSALAVAYMVSKSSAQRVYVDFLRDLPLKGWKQSFQDNIGLSVDQFYSDFSSFRNQSTASQNSTIFPDGLWKFEELIEESHYSAPSSGYPTAKQDLIDTAWNRSSSSSVMVSKDVDLRWKNTVKSILADVGEILGKYPAYFYGLTTETDSTYKQPLKDDLCRKAKITTSDCNDHFLSGYIDDNKIATYTIPGFAPPVSLIINTNNPIQESEILGTISSVPNERVYPIYLYVQNYLKLHLLDKTSTTAEYPKWIHRGLTHFFSVRIEAERVPSPSYSTGHFSRANRSDGPIQESISLETMEGWGSSDWPTGEWNGIHYSSLAIEYLIYKSSVQKVYVDFPRDIYLKGWTQSFQDNFGFTPTQFYSDFSTFIDQVKNDSTVLNNTFYPNGTSWKLKDEIDITAVSSGGSGSNTAPTINGLPNSISVAENQTAVTTVSASDSDGDTLTYSLSGIDAASFSISSSGVITFNSAPDYETKTSYSVTVNVSDGTATTSRSLTIYITDVDESSGSSSITVSSGAEVSLAFKSAPDYENPQDANQDNYYKVTINVSDGQETISREITVRIDDVQD